MAEGLLQQYHAKGPQFRGKGYFHMLQEKAFEEMREIRNKLGHMKTEKTELLEKFAKFGSFEKDRFCLFQISDHLDDIYDVAIMGEEKKIDIGEEFEVSKHNCQMCRKISAVTEELELPNNLHGCIWIKNKHIPGWEYHCILKSPKKELEDSADIQFEFFDTKATSSEIAKKINDIEVDDNQLKAEIKQLEKELKLSQKQKKAEIAEAKKNNKRARETEIIEILDDDDVVAVEKPAAAKTAPRKPVCKMIKNGVVVQLL
jgi:hypothetical protein